jgi:hypothetical protein
MAKSLLPHGELLARFGMLIFPPEDFLGIIEVTVEGHRNS